ncbi:methyltransferase-like protein 7A isoform X2 [Cucumis sativus]|uniref:methyltransferase-like protein 7A isoform X2 n=1 Tax=Cucumis sativus TaxID=3659 RepID=UPI0005EC1BA3|nr:methyltransferase-like protein 7A isoform X2 [Cucumis sativus]
MLLNKPNPDHHPPTARTRAFRKRHRSHVCFATTILAYAEEGVSLKQQQPHLCSLYALQWLLLIHPLITLVRSPKPDWYEDFYASVLANGMKSYEEEIAVYKSQMFANLRGKSQKVLEIGIGAGPNLKYYAGNEGMEVYGVDPNQKMEKYAREAAKNAGLPPESFEFKQAVGEAIPLPDASVDAVVGTLVLCSVTNVDMTLREVKRVLRPGGLYIFVEHVAAKEGTVLRFIQDVLDPLQQIVADGCHLTRRTGQNIIQTGFSNVDLNIASFSNAAFINPQVYGVAYR